MDRLTLLRVWFSTHPFYGGFASAGLILYELCTGQSLFEKDLKGMGGIAKCLPNSKDTGIMRACGIVHGEMAITIRKNNTLHRLWDVVCESIGRLQVFSQGRNDQYVTPADGVFVIKENDKYSGLDRHRDWYPFEPGQLQGICYVFPPPQGYVRLGCAFSYYRPHPDRCKSMKLAHYHIMQV